ncbi:MAG: c-type cytochrome [Calditrichaeota bacterium]|nr:c-type cytochrome [Calditrichota bacterium]
MLKKVLKWLGIVVAGIIGLLVLAALGIYMVSNSKINTTYDITVEAIAIPTDSAAVARGAHIAETRVCYDCHGPDLAGQVFMDAPPMGTIYASNLTSGNGGIGGQYSDTDWVRAIRHGVGADHKALFNMPSEAFWSLSDADLGALIAFLKQLPPVDNPHPAPEYGPVSRGLIALTGAFFSAAHIDHDAPRMQEVEAAATPEFGAYLAQLCAACHQADFSGGTHHGPPDWPNTANITPDPEYGIGKWSEADFFRAMREGKRPDGPDIHPEAMPRTIGNMTDDELKAIWLYLQTVPPVASKGKE